MYLYNWSYATPRGNCYSVEMKKAELELQMGYLINTFGPAIATGLSTMLNGNVSHDHIAAFIRSEKPYTSKDVWLQVKSTVRQIDFGRV